MTYATPGDENDAERDRWLDGIQTATNPHVCGRVSTNEVSANRVVVPQQQATREEAVPSSGLGDYVDRVMAAVRTPMEGPHHDMEDIEDERASASVPVVV